MVLYYSFLNLLILLIGIISIIHVQETNATYKPELKLVYPSNHEVLGENVKYKIQLFHSNSSLQESCNYDEKLLIDSITVGPFLNSTLENITHFFHFDKPLRTSILCFKITPLKNNENCTLCKDLVNYQMYNLTEDGTGKHASNLYMYHVCSNWNLTHQLNKLFDIKFGWNLVLDWKVNDSFKQCFEKFEIQLWYSSSWVELCKPAQNPPLLIMNTQDVFADRKTEFSNIKLGYNCLLIFGKHSTCLEDWNSKSWCSIARRTDVLNISGSVEPPVGEYKPKKDESRYWITVSCGIGVVLIVIGLVGTSLWYHFVVRVIPLDQASVSTTDTEIMENPDNNGASCPIEKIQYFKKKEVTILYTQEVPEILEAILALVHFLRSCCDLIVRIDVEDDANVRMNPPVWYSRGDFFIIVETDGAVYREEACIKNKCIYHLDDDFLDSYFMHSLSRIIHNPDSLVDYSKYFIVHFSFTKSQQRFQTVALSKRYVISQHLAQLCHFMTYGKDMIPSTKNLLRFAKKWKGNENLNALNCAITKASKFVCQNPDYIKTVFRERSISVTDSDDDQTQML